MSEDIVQLMDGINLARPARRGKEIEKERQDRIALDEETRRLVHVAQETAAQASHVQKLNGDSSILLSRHVAALSPLIRKSTEIAEIGHALKLATREYIVARLRSLDSGSHDVNKLLSHFKPKLEGIVGNILEATRVDENILLKILEECHRQSSSESGDLHIDNYFAPLYEAALASPYDPDFESEEYYDHEARLQVDEDYAEAESMRQQQKFEDKIENERRTERAWIGFWVLGANGEFEDLPVTPQYLVRTFDFDSSGRSDGDLVASSASIYMRPEVSREDLLSLGRKEACEKLYAHLNKDCFGNAEYADNLMSWSSSLLFVIQYAVWRCNRRRCPSAHVKVCVVDTTKFPHGQFARDMWLINKCYNTADDNSKMQNLIHLRENGYDNGEYLSQGTLSHKNRSCVVTLEKLIQSGLYDLYPEFDDPSGREQWTKRVRDLRLTWAEPCSTTREELRVASQIATTCFHEVGASELAVFLLTFKTRELRSSPTKDNRPWHRNSTINEPEDVQKYLSAIEAFNSQAKKGCLCTDVSFPFI